MLEDLFTSKTRTKLLLYLLFSKDKLRLRELARKVKVPVSAVARELKNLQKLSLIQKEKDYFSINDHCNLLPELRGLFLKTDALKFSFGGAFKKKQIEFAFIFGSFANDNYTAESDIDLFVIGKITNEELFKLVKLLEKSIQREINPLVWSREELNRKKASSFVKDIFKKKVIMVKGKEDELRKIVK